MVLGNPHVPVSTLVDGVVECRICGLRVYGYPGHLRHEGETDTYRPINASPEDRAAVARAREAARRAAPDQAALADAVVDALYRQGLLRRRPSRTALSLTG
jgi:hypothetical protein